MTALYEELGKSGKKWEQLEKSDAPIFLTVYEALHMKIYEAPHMNFGELPRSPPGSTRSSPGSAGKRREAPAAPDSVRELRK